MPAPGVAWPLTSRPRGEWFAGTIIHQCGRSKIEQEHGLDRRLRQRKITDSDPELARCLASDRVTASGAAHCSSPPDSEGCNDVRRRPGSSVPRPGRTVMDPVDGSLHELGVSGG